MLLDLPRSGGPLYRRIYLALKTSIRGGRLNPGARLPSTRTLAADLGVSRNSVLLAYEQLAAEGYVVNRDRSAASVAETQPERRAASRPRFHGAGRECRYRAGSDLELRDVAIAFRFGPERRG